jgi:fatty-acyl-CoA synthase
MFVPLTPIRCIERAVELFGNRVGIISGTSQFTYAEFGDRSSRLAAALRQLGIRLGDRVAYLSFNNHQLLEGYFGVPQARAILMPLNVRLSLHELTSILNHSGARLLLFETDFAPLVEELKETCPSIEHFVSLGETVPVANCTYEELLKGSEPEKCDVKTIDENAVCELFYTSGSTGTPKGVMLSHRTLYMHALSVALLYESVETVVDLHTIPFFHANGWGRPQASTLMGVKQVLVRRFDPPAVLKLIQDHRITDMSLVPTMAVALLNSTDLGVCDVSSVRNITIGGAASSPELTERMERAFQCKVTAAYGLTETSPMLSSARQKRDVECLSETDRLRRQTMTGWPVVNMRMRVVDSKMRDVPRDMKTVGEIVTFGDHVMDGYFGDPDATASVISDGWLRTGDMAVWDEEAYVSIVDRKKEIIISGGENISSIQVEGVIASHPEVLECAVVAAPDEKWGEVPVAIVVRKPGATLDSEELVEYLQSRLGKFKVPRIIEFWDEPLPKTGTGKIRKLVLREHFWQGKERRIQG